MTPEEHPTWKVIDSTKLKTFIRCPRKYFFEYLLGWAQDVPAHDLHFGTSVHYALEFIYNAWKVAGEPLGYPEKLLAQAYEVFFKCYSSEFDTIDPVHNTKNPEGFLLLLDKYGQRYHTLDKFTVLHTEISGSVPIGEDGFGNEKRIYFRLDAVVEDEKNGKYILEHKTSAWREDKWRATFPLSTQIGTGNHVLCCLYPREEVYGMIINGLFFIPYTKSGDKYKGYGDDLVRLPQRLNKNSAQAWLVRTNYYYDSLQQHLQALNDETEDDQVMASFPCNESACFDFNRICPFKDFCDHWQNPLQHCRSVPVGFKHKFWDPRSLDTNDTTKVEL